MSDRERPLVTILPGSRTQEVTHNLEMFLRAAAIVRGRVPQARFAVASFKPHQAQIARRMVQKSGVPAEVFVRRTPELIQAAQCCLAVSGSVSLELLYQTRPTAILYWISPLAYWVQKQFRHTRYITLVNMLASDDVFPRDLTPYDPTSPRDAGVPFPEYLTCEDKSQALAEHITRWLTDRAEHERITRQLAELKSAVGHGGATRQASQYILATLAERPPTEARPHYVPPASEAPVLADPRRAA
jgi:lipid-A-disaccharide synthase